MKMSKKIRTLVSTALISAMVLTMGGMSAFAATITAPDGQIPVTKKVTVDQDNYTFSPVTEYEFEVTPGTHTSLEYTVNGGTQTVVVYAGPEDGLKGVKVTNATAATTSEAEFVYNTEKLTVDPAKFVDTDGVIKPGVYHYVVSEIKGTYPGMVYDTTKYNVYLFMEYATGGNSLECAGVVVTKINDDGSASTKTDLVFVNTYDMHDLTITKSVTGNQGNTKVTFEVNVKVVAGNTEKDGSSTEKYVVKYTEKGNEGECVLQSGETRTFNLMNTDTVHIYGLSEDDQVLVNEKEAYKSDGYTVSYSSTNVTEVEDSDITDTTQTDDSDFVVVKVNDDNATVTITNNKSVTTPTGIVMTFGPYVLLIALAGVFATLFFRRKREEF